MEFRGNPEHWLAKDGLGLARFLMDAVDQLLIERTLLQHMSQLSSYNQRMSSLCIDIAMHVQLEFLTDLQIHVPIADFNTISCLMQNHKTCQ